MVFCFETFDLDPRQRELRVGGRQVHVEPQVFDLLVLLVENRERVIGKDEIFARIWDGRIVSESTLSSRINAARRALGDDGVRQSLIRTVARRGFRFVGNPAPPGQALRMEVPAGTGTPPAAGARQQDIRFCRSSDGVELAYATVGAGYPIVKAANYLSHLEYDWESPVWRDFLKVLSRDNRLIRYDARGTGMSDWNVDRISFDDFVRDLETVIETTGVERFALLGISQGCATSIAYAIRYPERVSHLILHGGYAQGRLRRQTQVERERGEAIIALMKAFWGTEQDGFSRMFSALFIPDGTEEQTRWWIDLQRVSASAENAVRIRRACDEIDIVDLLPRVAVPTLVLHSRREAVQPFEQSRLIASSIPNARFVPLDSANHIVLPQEPAWAGYIAEILAFLDGG
ncbi:MAG: alpha/beta fold hydrolase [Rhodospirillaceae bacterium]